MEYSLLIRKISDSLKPLFITKRCSWQSLPSRRHFTIYNKMANVKFRAIESALIQVKSVPNIFSKMAHFSSYVKIRFQTIKLHIRYANPIITE